MPLFGLGTWRISPGHETEQAVAWALEAGYRDIDTAAAYPNERCVGTALRNSRLARDEVFVTTKWMPVRPNPPHELARSLERLRLDYVDLSISFTGRCRGPTSAVGTGSKRSMPGASHGRSGSATTGRTPSHACSSVPPARWRSTRSSSAPCTSGAGSSSSAPIAGSRSRATARSTNDRALAHPVIGEIAQRLDRQPAQIMLRWAVQHEVIVIPKSTHRERIRANADVFTFTLDDTDMSALDALDTSGGTGKAR